MLCGKQFFKKIEMLMFSLQNQFKKTKSTLSNLTTFSIGKGGKN